MTPKTAMPSMMSVVDRPPDEELGSVHDPAFAPLASRTVTRLPGTSRRCPSVTTDVAGLESLPDHRLSAGEPRDRHRSQLDGLVVLDDVDVAPSGPVCTAADGTTMAAGSVASRTTTLANCPGQSVRSRWRTCP